MEKWFFCYACGWKKPVDGNRTYRNINGKRRQVCQGCAEDWDATKQGHEADSDPGDIPFTGSEPSYNGAWIAVDYN